MSRPVVLCATDFSDAATRAADLAAACATALGGALRLVHVADLGPGGEAIVVPPSMEAAAGAMRARLRARAEELAHRLELERARIAVSVPEVEVELIEGRPWQSIVEAASHHDATLVVVAPHGGRGPREVAHGALRERLLGSTADRVVRYAPCPVLVTSTAPTTATVLEGSRWLAAVDFSEASLAGVATARAWAARVHGSAVLVHVLPTREHLQMDRAEAAGFEELHAHEEADALARLHATLGATPADTPVRIRRGDDAEEIAGAARDEGATFLVMGTHARKGLAHFVLGSVVERVLRRTDAHVLCIHSTDRARA